MRPRSEKSRRPARDDRRSGHQLLQIQQMLGLEGLLRPSRAGMELHADEVADLAVVAVADDTGKLLFRRLPLDLHPEGDRVFHLETCARSRNILEQGGGSPES